MTRNPAFTVDDDLAGWSANRCESTRGRAPRNLPAGGVESVPARPRNGAVPSCRFVASILTVGRRGRHFVADPLNPSTAK
jgi:hypothetical protein